jgi:hypothetical protein
MSGNCDLRRPGFKFRTQTRVDFPHSPPGYFLNCLSCPLPSPMLCHLDPAAGQHLAPSVVAHCMEGIPHCCTCGPVTSLCGRVRRVRQAPSPSSLSDCSWGKIKKLYHWLTRYLITDKRRRLAVAALFSLRAHKRIAATSWAV